MRVTALSYIHNLSAYKAHNVITKEKILALDLLIYFKKLWRK